MESKSELKVKWLKWLGEAIELDLWGQIVESVEVYEKFVLVCDVWLNWLKNRL